MFFCNTQAIAYDIPKWILSYFSRYIPKTAKASSDTLGEFNTENKYKSNADLKVKNLLTESGEECIQFGTFLNKTGGGILAATFSLTSFSDYMSPACCTSYSKLTPSQGFSPTYPIKLTGYTTGSLLLGAGTAFTFIGSYLKDTDNDINSKDITDASSKDD